MGIGSGINSMLYNKLLGSAAHIKIVVPNSTLVSTLCIKHTVLGSTARAINTILVSWLRRRQNLRKNNLQDGEGPESAPENQRKIYQKHSVQDDTKNTKVDTKSDAPNVTKKKPTRYQAVFQSDTKKVPSFKMT